MQEPMRNLCDRQVIHHSIQYVRCDDVPSNNAQQVSTSVAFRQRLPKQSKSTARLETRTSHHRCLWVQLNDVSFKLWNTHPLDLFTGDRALSRTMIVHERQHRYPLHMCCHVRERSA